MTSTSGLLFGGGGEQQAKPLPMSCGVQTRGSAGKNSSVGFLCVERQTGREVVS